MNCPAITCNPNTEFQCTESYCITSKWVCDGDYDCLDGKDEQGCAKPPSTVSFCLPKEYECGDHLTCIHRAWLCDGTKDCPDGSDESPANCQNITCRPDQFQCKDRSCISGHLHCNKDKDCPDGSDEEDCGKFKVFYRSLFIVSWSNAVSKMYF